MERWAISIDAWVIQDGNYPDFAVGDSGHFALEFYLPDGPTLVDAGATSVRPLGNGWYEITGTVVAASDDTWVVDFGLLAYDSSAPPEGVGVGQWVTGRALLQVDHYWYFEVLARREAFPPQMYGWTIESIRRHAAPFVPDPTGKARMMREPGNETYAELEETDAWNDDGGYASYVLECRLDDDRPRRPGDY